MMRSFKICVTYKSFPHLSELICSLSFVEGTTRHVLNARVLCLWVCTRIKGHDLLCNSLQCFLWVMLSKSVYVRPSTQSIFYLFIYILSIFYFIYIFIFALATYRESIAKLRSHLLTSFAAIENTLLRVWSQGQVSPKSRILSSNCTIICCKMKVKTVELGKYTRSTNMFF